LTTIIKLATGFQFVSIINGA